MLAADDEESEEEDAASQNVSISDASKVLVIRCPVGKVTILLVVSTGVSSAPALDANRLHVRVCERADHRFESTNPHLVDLQQGHADPTTPVCKTGRDQFAASASQDSR